MYCRILEAELQKLVGNFCIGYTGQQNMHVQGNKSKIDTKKFDIENYLKAKKWQTKQNIVGSGQIYATLFRRKT